MRGKLPDKLKLVGAGGAWRVINERRDLSVVKQQTSLSCAAAVGEMLLHSCGIKLPQSQILAKIGQPASAQTLAHFLREVDHTDDGTSWHGLFVATENYLVLCGKGSWGAVLREGAPLGHLVMVEGVDALGLIKIKDPFAGTAYEMTEREFFVNWGGEAVFRWKF